jgi:hypothetical protein
MNKLALLLALIISLKPSLANQVVRTDFGPAAALNEKATILQDTIGATDGREALNVFRAVYDNDTASLDTLFANGKCLLIKKGTIVTPTQWGEGMATVIYQGKPVKGSSDQFSPGTYELWVPYSALLPPALVDQDRGPIYKYPASAHPGQFKTRRRVPIHTPRQSPYIEFLEGISQQNNVDLSTRYAIVSMMGGDANYDVDQLISPHVVYGPIRDRTYKTGSSWLVEVSFQIPNDSHSYTAVVHEGAGNRANVPCELGEDEPTLKDGEFAPMPPPPVNSYIPKSPDFSLSNESIQRAISEIPSKSAPTPATPALTPVPTPTPRVLTPELAKARQDFQATWNALPEATRQELEGAKRQWELEDNSNQPASAKVKDLEMRTSLLKNYAQ